MTSLPSNQRMFNGQITAAALADQGAALYGDVLVTRADFSRLDEVLKTALERAPTPIPFEDVSDTGVGIQRRGAGNDESRSQLAG